MSNIFKLILCIYLGNIFALHSYNKPQEINSVGSIEVAFSPNGGVTNLIVSAINHAKTQILVEAYSFTSKDIANAIMNAKKRGVDIWILLDKTQAKSGYSSAKFFSDLGIGNLRIDKAHAIFHNKVMIIDHINIITGSFNFTKSAEEKNAENLLYIKGNKKLCDIYKKEFAYNWDLAVPYIRDNNG